MYAIALPFLGGIGVPELVIISVILMTKCLPVVLIAVVVVLLVRAQRKRVDAPGPSQAAAGWLVDPSTRHQLRYWDGATWTQFVSDDGVLGEDRL